MRATRRRRRGDENSVSKGRDIAQQSADGVKPHAPLDERPRRALLSEQMTSVFRTWGWAWRHERGGSVA
jgi:hypothetical protein